MKNSVSFIIRCYGKLEVDFAKYSKSNIFSFVYIVNLNVLFVYCECEILHLSRVSSVSLCLLVCCCFLVCAWYIMCDMLFNAMASVDVSLLLSVSVSYINSLLFVWCVLVVVVFFLIHYFPLSTFISLFLSLSIALYVHIIDVLLFHKV